MSGVDDAGGPRGARAPGASGDEPRRHGGWRTRRVLQLLPQVGDPGRAPERRERSLHADRIVRPAAPRRRSPRGRTFSGAVVHHVSRSYTMSRGRTLLRTVVPSCARSYLRAPGGYDFASPGTTARPRVRLRVPGYDRASPGTTARARVRPRGRAGPIAALLTQPRPTRPRPDPGSLPPDPSSRSHNRVAGAL